MVLVVMVVSLSIVNMLSWVCRNMRYCEMTYLGINYMTNVFELVLVFTVQENDSKRRIMSLYWQWGRVNQLG